MDARTSHWQSRGPRVSCRVMLERRVGCTFGATASPPHGPVYYVSPLLEQAGVRHAFSTRLGGVSAAPFDSLNLGNPTGCAVQDDDPHIRENYRFLQTAIGCSSHTRLWLQQVHGGAVA